jgi:hypothetical protein
MLHISAYIQLLVLSHLPAHYATYEAGVHRQINMDIIAY